jgi:hypothetical protein
MLEDWIALVSLLAELPHEVTDEIVRWAWSCDRVVTGRAQGNDADAALHSAAATDTSGQLLAALQRVGELSDHDRQAVQAQAGTRRDRYGVLAAKALSAATHTHPSEYRCAGMTLNVVRDLAMLPLPIITDAVILLGEVTFPPRSALAAVDWLASHSWAVAAMEAWRPVGKQISVVDISAYDGACAQIKEWAQKVACCAQGARDFIDIYVNDDEVVFNLFWKSQHAARFATPS